MSTLRLLGRLLWDALPWPRRSCPACRTHARINTELSTRLITALDRPPVLVVRVPAVGVWVCGDRATPPLGLPRLPVGPLPGWASLYEADDPDCATVDV